MFERLCCTVLLLLMLIVLGGCAARDQLLPDDMPSPAASAPTVVVTPASTPPRVILQTDTPRTTVGSEIMVQIDLIGLGIPVYMISLSPGISIRVSYSDDNITVQTPEPTTAPFRVISPAGEIASGTLRLLAVQPGDATLTIAVSGEAGLPAGPFYWTIVQSNPLLLTALSQPYR